MVMRSLVRRNAHSALGLLVSPPFQFQRAPRTAEMLYTQLALNSSPVAVWPVGKLHRSRNRSKTHQLNKYLPRIDPDLLSKWIWKVAEVVEASSRTRNVDRWRLSCPDRIPKRAEDRLRLAIPIRIRRQLFQIQSTVLYWAEPITMEQEIVSAGRHPSGVSRASHRPTGIQVRCLKAATRHQNREIQSSRLAIRPVWVTKWPANGWLIQPRRRFSGWHRKTNGEVWNKPWKRLNKQLRQIKTRRNYFLLWPISRTRYIFKKRHT